MASSRNHSRRIVVDNIHGDIALSDLEWRVVNTSTFQRLRSLKQLGMGHLVYPNATHTRFAHSLGVLGIMSRIVSLMDEQASGSRQRLSDEDGEVLRLAALLHDVGHYPYSHLMERIDRVSLTEEVVDAGPPIEAKLSRIPYVDHEELGRHILEQQQDIREAVGGEVRAKLIGAVFSRLQAADSQFTKLIHSSLDMDRLDYLLRDARAAGVPYGEIDLNYLLNNIRVSPSGVIGVSYKALAAAEHFLLARLFMHRAVYYHKTTYAFEEACRQLLRRMRDSGRYALLPHDGAAILKLCATPGLRDFTDDLIDRAVREAVVDGDRVIGTLARCIAKRTPPRLLGEVCGLERAREQYTATSFFRQNCRNRLADLAKRFDLAVGQFLLCGPKPIKIEERGSLLTRDDIRDLQPEEREELIKVFEPGNDEPRSIVDVDGSMIRHIADHPWAIQRLYVADDSPEAATRFVELKSTVQSWINPRK